MQQEKGGCLPVQFSIDLSLYAQKIINAFCDAMGKDKTWHCCLVRVRFIRSKWKMQFLL